MARKTKYDPETFPLMAEGWARQGLSDKQIASNLRISQDTFYQYKKKFPEFSEALKKGKKPVDFEVENSFLKRANGFEYEEVKTTILTTPQEVKKAKKSGLEVKHVVLRQEKTKKFIPPDTAACFIWLKNRMPDRWKDRREHTFPEGVTLNISDDFIPDDLGENQERENDG